MSQAQRVSHYPGVNKEESIIIRGLHCKCTSFCCCSFSKMRLNSHNNKAPCQPRIHSLCRRLHSHTFLFLSRRKKAVRPPAVEISILVGGNGGTLTDIPMFVTDWEWDQNNSKWKIFQLDLFLDQSNGEI